MYTTINKKLFWSLAFLVFIGGLSANTFAQSQNEVEISVLFDGTARFGDPAYPDNAPNITNDPTAPQLHTPGSDGGANNLVVRTHDQFAVRIDWNINEADATGVALTVELPVHAEWTVDNTLGYSGCIITDFSADPLTDSGVVVGRFLEGRGSQIVTCELGDQHEGSNGTIRMTALLNEVFDDTLLDVTSTLTTDDDTTGVSDNLDQLLTVSEAPFIDYIKNAPITSALIMGDNEMGYVVFFPLSFNDHSQGAEIKGIGPINDTVPVPLFDHMWNLTPSVRLASPDEMLTAGFAGLPCGDYAQGIADSNVGPYVVGNGSWSCGAETTSIPGDYPVVPITVSGFTSRPVVMTLADGSANATSVPQVTAGQIALWLTKEEVDFAIADPNNPDIILNLTTGASFENSLVEQDENEEITDADLVVDARGNGTNSVTNNGNPANNTAVVSFGATPNVGGGVFGGGSVNPEIDHDIKFRPGPLELFESINDFNDEARHGMWIADGGLGALPGANIERHAFNGNDNIGQTARGQILTIDARIDTRGDGINERIHGCAAFDDTHYNLVAIDSNGAGIPLTVLDDNEALVSQTIVAANAGPLAHVLIGPTDIRSHRHVGVLRAITSEPSANFTLEFGNPTVPNNGTGIFGFDYDQLTCNDSDGGDGWISSDDPIALAAAFDPDGDGVYEGITRARISTDEPITWGDFRGTGDEIHSLRVFFQVQVKTDLFATPNNTELFTGFGHSYGDVDANGQPDLDAGDNIGSCRPININAGYSSNWISNGNDFNSTTGWCNQKFEDIAGIDWDQTASVVTQNRRQSKASGSEVFVVGANLGLSKVNAAGTNDIKDNGQIVEFVITPRVTGSNQEALTNVRLTDTLIAEYEFIQFTSQPTTNGAICEHNAGVISCQFSESDPTIDSGIVTGTGGTGDLAEGLPGGWSDSFSFTVMVTGAIAQSDSATVLTNTATVRSDQVGFWDINTNAFGRNTAGEMVTLGDAARAVNNSARSFLPLPADESDIVKSLAELEGVCTQVPATFTGTAAEWAERCQLIDLDGNMTFDLTIENEGNTRLLDLEIIDIFPFNSDDIDPEFESNTPNQTGSPATAGDGRTPGSDYNGTLAFVGVTPVNLPAGLTIDQIWVTGDAPTTISRDPERSVRDTDDPAAPAPNTWCNAVGGTVQNGGSGSCPATAEAVTAVYVLFDGTGFIPDETATIRLELDTTNSECGDLWTNTYGARSSNTTLPIRSNDVSIQTRCPISIGSYVWNDADSDGVQDAGELGINNALVELFVFDPDTTAFVPAVDLQGVAVASQTTSSTGLYNFTNLPPGDYQVQVTPPTGFTPTVNQNGSDDAVETDSNIASEPSSGVFRSGTINLAIDDEVTESGTAAGDTQDDNAIDPLIDSNGNMTVDFGFVLSAIGDTVFYDLDGDGIQDPEDSGIPSVAIQLDYIDPITNLPVTLNGFTGPDGMYLFGNLPQGVTYTVTTDMTSLPGTLGVDLVQTVDADGLGTINSSTTTLDANNPIDLDQDFGYQPRGTIGDLVWFDSNNDGIVDAGEDGISGVTVTLTPPPGIDLGNGVNVPITVVTGDTDGDGDVDANDDPTAAGTYLFTGLPVGAGYTVTVDPATLPDPVFQQTFDDDGLASAHTSTTDLLLVVSPSGVPFVQSDIDQDFGYVEPVSIGGYFFEDANNNGLQDTSEVPVPGSTVTIWIDDGNGNGNFIAADDLAGNAVGSQVVGADGLYFFDNLPEGDYRVRVTEPAGFVPTGIQQTADDDDTLNDSNIASEPTPNVYESGVFTLDAGNELSGSAEDEVGDDQDDAAIARDESGNMTVDFGFVRMVSIGSVVWLDANGDGVQDAAESLTTTGSVMLLNADGTPALDIDGNLIPSINLAIGSNGTPGTYFFDGISEGDYVVKVTPATGLVPTPTQTATDDSGANELDSNIDVNTTLTVPAGSFVSPVINLQFDDEVIEIENEGLLGDGDDVDNGEDSSGDMTIDFGFVSPVSVGSVIWHDLNGDGIQTATEPLLTQGTVELLDSNGNVVTTDLSGVAISPIDLSVTNGTYLFDNLPVGDYQVRVRDLPQGFLPTPVQTTADDDVNNDSNIAVSDTTNGIYTSGTFTLNSGAEPSGVGEVSDITTAGDDADDANDADGNMTIDFGFVQPASIGSVVWEDSNADGFQDANELLISVGTVTLLDATGNPVTTDINGNPIIPVDLATTGGTYLFDNLVPGDYQVQVSSLLPTYSPSPIQTVFDNDNTLDDSNIASEPSPGTYISGIFNLSNNSQPQSFDEISLITGAGDLADDADDDDGNMTVDFGFVAPFSVGSLVWEDLNGDGLQDVNEPSITSATVTLWVESGGVFVPAVDLNNNVIASQTTGFDGLYFFDDLVAGMYQVQVTPPPNLFASPVQSLVDDNNSLDSNIVGETAVGSGVYISPPFELASGTEPIESGSERGDNQDDSGIEGNGNMTLDFGFVPPASIGDRVWTDLDRDGIQDSSEDPIIGVTVLLTPPPTIDLGNGLGVAITTTTDVNGNYLFSGLPPFSDPNSSIGYVVSVDPATLPLGYSQTYDEGDGVGATDNTSDPIQLNPLEFHETADFGYAPADGAIGDRVWIDANGDGVQDLSEQGIPNVTVTLTPAPTVDLGNGPGVPLITTTNANGNYLFTDLPLDELYIVTVDESTLPTGYFSDPDGDGDPDVRAGNSTVPDSETLITLTQNEPVNLNADFGYLPPEDQNNSVGDTVWLDIDGDGTQNNGEAGIAGVTIDLVDPTTSVVIASTVTDGNGNYLFNGIPDGIYDVVVTDTNGILTNYDQTFDNDGLGSANTSQVDLDSFGLSDTPIADIDQDFAYNNPSSNPGAIGDTVFFDANGDGVLDAGEGIQGVVVQLFDAAGNLIDSTTTDANGNYVFDDLPVSATGETYSMQVDTSTLPNGGSGWSNSIDPDGASDSSSQVTLTDVAPVNLDQDFGYIGEGENAIMGTVWSDSDGSGTQEEAATFASVTIELLDANGNLIATTVTDANGDYEFTGLPDGVYSVVVTDINNILSSFSHTDSPNGVSDTSDQTSKDDTGYTVDLDSLSTSDDPVIDETGDFGYMSVVTNPISLASFVTEKSGNELTVRWTTQTEVGNLGFYIYAQQQGEWLRLNEALITSNGDSTQVQSYNATFVTNAQRFAISDIDLYGKETIHGPFKLGQQHGIESERKVIDWEGIDNSKATNDEVLQQNNSVINRELLKRQQMIEKRSNRRLLK